MTENERKLMVFLAECVAIQLPRYASEIVILLDAIKQEQVELEAPPGDKPTDDEIDVTNMSSTHYEFLHRKTGTVRTGDLITRPAIPKG
jgi:hypothetical protein